MLVFYFVFCTNMAWRWLVLNSGRMLWMIWEDHIYIGKRKGFVLVSRKQMYKSILNFVLGLSLHLKPRNIMVLASDYIPILLLCLSWGLSVPPSPLASCVVFHALPVFVSWFCLPAFCLLFCPWQTLRRSITASGTVSPCLFLPAGVSFLPSL